MHNLALDIANQGHKVTGSDDKIFEPSRTRLKNKGLLPEHEGWFPDKISSEVDAIILGMHARADNPELEKAKQLGLKIYSFPEFIYENSKEKKRIVIAGSHGKTTITSMIIHVLTQLNMKFDYLVGSQLPGFDRMVKLSDAPLIIIEGDEYLTSPDDLRPKFLHYHPDITLISGIAWDHFNVFPTYDMYVNQFSLLLKSLNSNSKVIYYKHDIDLLKIIVDYKPESYSYEASKYAITDNGVVINSENKVYTIQIFGKHNLENLEGAKLVCENLGISNHDFYTAISSFSGAAKRLEKILETEKLIIFRDFAHSPSKVKATVNAVKERYANKRVIAVYELHTFSSLNKNFIDQYAGCLDKADVAMVYFNLETLKQKNLEVISDDQIKTAFNNQEIVVSTDSKEIIKWVQLNIKTPSIVLFMSSGNFDNIELTKFS